LPGFAGLDGSGRLLWASPAFFDFGRSGIAPCRRVTSVLNSLTGSRCHRRRCAEDSAGSVVFLRTQHQILHTLEEAYTERLPRKRTNIEATEGGRGRAGKRVVSPQGAGKSNRSCGCTEPSSTVARHFSAHTLRVARDENLTPVRHQDVFACKGTCLLAQDPLAQLRCTVRGAAFACLAQSVTAATRASHYDQAAQTARQRAEQNL
jgi:hypothetical protein